MADHDVATPGSLAEVPDRYRMVEPVMDEPIVIYETVHGSTAYGLARPGSDIDVKGILVGPAPWYLGWAGGPAQIELSADHVRYEIRKFFRLAADANPTVLELLWTSEEHHVTVTATGRRLLDARDAFLSQRVAERFGRYALGQLKRIQSHRTWLHTPPAAAPTRARFGLLDQTVMPREQLAAAEALLQEGAHDAADASPNFVELLSREKRFKAAQAEWRHYNDWLRNRNPARSALERRFGYDTKHAMHLVRIQRMALEVLTTGALRVLRPDRDELLAVRDGAWTFEELEERTTQMATAIEDAVDDSTLPTAPDEAALDRLCVEIVAEHLEC